MFSTLILGIRFVSPIEFYFESEFEEYSVSIDLLSPLKKFLDLLSGDVSGSLSSFLH